MASARGPRTAVVVLLPDAEPLLAAVRRLAAELVRPLPAHVSLLYPGPPPDQIAGLAGALGPLPAEVELGAVLTGPDGFVGVAVPGLTDAVARLRRAFPELVPYGGRFGDQPPPHVTVALGASQAQAGPVERIAATAVGTSSRVVGPYLAVRDEDGRWRVTDLRSADG